MGHRDDDFVTILSTSDPVRAEIIRDVLEQEGIVATIPGHMHSSLLGAAGGVLLSIRIQVPSSRAEEALAIIEAMEDFDAVLPDGEDGPEVPAEEMERRMELLEAEDHGDEGPYRSGPLVDARRSPRNKRLAFMAALALTFGAGHFYARDSRTGLLILLAELLAIGMGMAGDGHAFLAVPILIAGDIIGALRAVDRYNTGLGEKTATQKAARAAPWVSVALVCFGFGVPFVYAKAAPVAASADAIETICEQQSDCLGENPSTCEERLVRSLEQGYRTPFDLRRCAACMEETSCEAVAGGASMECGCDF